MWKISGTVSAVFIWVRRVITELTKTFQGRDSAERAAQEMMAVPLSTAEQIQFVCQFLFFLICLKISFFATALSMLMLTIVMASGLRFHVYSRELLLVVEFIGSARAFPTEVF